MTPCSLRPHSVARLGGLSVQQPILTCSKTAHSDRAYTQQCSTHASPAAHHGSGSCSFYDRHALSQPGSQLWDVVANTHSHRLQSLKTAGQKAMRQWRAVLISARRPLTLPPPGACKGPAHKGGATIQATCLFPTPPHASQPPSCIMSFNPSRSGRAQPLFEAYTCNGTRPSTCNGAHKDAVLVSPGPGNDAAVMQATSCQGSSPLHMLLH